MALTAADVLIESLRDWGVEVVFGLPGDGINGIMEALRKRRDQVRFIQVRHEEAAALMACGYAKFTGRLGVCLATSGPGGIHLLNGLYDAALDGQPVVAITGMAFHDLIGTHTQQDVALDRLFADVAKFNQRIMGPSHVENVTHLACRTALAYRGVAHLTVPVDIQEMDAGAYRSKRNVKHHTSDVYGRSARLPAEDQLASAAEVLNAGKKVAILAGRCVPPTSSSRPPIGSPPRSSRRSWARPPCRTTAPTPRARSACSERSPRRKRWRNATRSSWSARRFRTSSSCPSPARRTACRSSSTRCESACGIRSRSGWSAIAPERCRRSCAC